jgi:hypothetical protein
MVAGVGYTLKTPIELSGEPTYGAFKVLHSNCVLQNQNLST